MSDNESSISDEKCHLKKYTIKKGKDFYVVSVDKNGEVIKPTFIDIPIEYFNKKDKVIHIESFKKECLDNLNDEVYYDVTNIGENNDADVDSLGCLHDNDRPSYYYFCCLLILFMNNKPELKLPSDKITSLDKNLLEEKIMTFLCQIGKLRYSQTYLYDHNLKRYRIDIGINNSNRKNTTHKKLVNSFILDEYNEFVNNNNKELNLFYVIMSLIQK